MWGAHFLPQTCWRDQKGRPFPRCTRGGRVEQTKDEDKEGSQAVLGIVAELFFTSGAFVSFSYAKKSFFFLFFNNYFYQKKMGGTKHPLLPVFICCTIEERVAETRTQAVFFLLGPPFCFSFLFSYLKKRLAFAKTFLTFKDPLRGPRGPFFNTPFLTRHKKKFFLFFNYLSGGGTGGDFIVWKGGGPYSCPK